MSRLPAYSVRVQGMEKYVAVSATRDFATVPTTRGEARPIDLSASASIRIDARASVPAACAISEV
jgi:hypothetical protein